MDYGIRQARKVKNQTKKFNDITTKLEHTREMLHISEDKYRQLVENADCIILRMGKDGKITFFNEFAQKFFGYTVKEIVGKNVIRKIATKEDDTGRNLAELVRDIKWQPELYSAFENEHICKNGRRVWVAWANKYTAPR